MSDDFLSRWSRRKREADTADAAAVPEAPPAESVVETGPEEDDEELLARLGLKHPEEMESGDDFGAFLRSAVPQHLKTIAYRRLWRSNPTLACLDGLNDYDGDFTGTGVPEGGLKTAYQVGRGLLGRITEVAESDVKEAAAEDACATLDVDEPEDDAGIARSESPSDAPESAQQNDAPRPTHRRMVFRPGGVRPRN